MIYVNFSNKNYKKSTHFLVNIEKTGQKGSLKQLPRRIGWTTRRDPNQRENRSKSPKKTIKRTRTIGNSPPFYFLTVAGLFLVVVGVVAIDEVAELAATDIGDSAAEAAEAPPVDHIPDAVIFSLPRDRSIVRRGG